MKNENIAATYKSLNNYLEMAMRTENITRIVEALKEFKKRSIKILFPFVNLNVYFSQSLSQKSFI